MSGHAAWLTLALLGGYHGLNPAMGWLFAVALGMQEGRVAATLRALPPIAVGHAISIGLVVALVGLAQVAVPIGLLRAAGAAVLLGFAALIVARRSFHPRWVGMRVGFRDLVAWSFLMSSAHGAGLMLVPVLLHLPVGGSRADMAASHAGMAAPQPHMAQSVAQNGVAALAVHTTAMFAVMAVLAVVIYRTVGVDLLRRVWINLDLVWAGALVLAAAATLLLP